MRYNRDRMRYRSHKLRWFFSIILRSNTIRHTTYEYESKGFTKVTIRTSIFLLLSSCSRLSSVMATFKAAAFLNFPWMLLRRPKNNIGEKYVTFTLNVKLSITGEKIAFRKMEYISGRLEMKLLSQNWRNCTWGRSALMTGHEKQTTRFFGGETSALEASLSCHKGKFGPPVTGRPTKKVSRGHARKDARSQPIVLDGGILVLSGHFQEWNVGGLSILSRPTKKSQ